MKGQIQPARPRTWEAVAGSSILVGVGTLVWVKLHGPFFASAFTVTGSALITIGACQLAVTLIDRRRAESTRPPLSWSGLRTAFVGGSRLALAVVLLACVAAVVFGFWLLGKMP